MINPVLAKEFKDRVRTWRSPATLLLYTGVLAVVGGLYYYVSTRNIMGGPQILRLGVQIFSLLFFLQLFLVAFLSPGITAGIISGERERQTLPLLLVTRLSPLNVVAGKLLSAVSYVLMLIIVSLPLYSIVFLFGGVSLVQLLKSAGLLLATTLTLGSIGLMMSAFFKRTVVAVLVSYFSAFFLILGTAFLGVIIAQLTRLPGGQVPEPHWIFYLNPLVAMASTLPAGSSLLPLVGLGMNNSINLPFWQGNLFADALIILVTLSLTVRLIQPLSKGNKRGE